MALIRHAIAIVLLCSTTFAALLCSTTPAAWAQMELPAAAPPNGATLFRNQCATCHTLNASDPQRQGPTLAGVWGRKAGSVPGFHYSAGFANADWNWDEAHLDPYLANPQAVIPGAVMPYKQADAARRHAIIEFLKGQP
jgi:cytochrome c